MLRRIAVISTVYFLCFSLNVCAMELTLEQVWHDISTDSKSQQASKLELQAANIGKIRAAKHWLPQVYLDARSYETNDPGLSFLGILSERSVTVADFEPNSLNHPGSHLYSRGALGVDWPLYEGGAKVAQEAMQEHVVASKCCEVNHTKIAQYAEIARIYGTVQGLADQRTKLKELELNLNRVLQNYQIGEKSNPIGYSGLLGLKNLANRIDGLLAENRAKEQTNRAELTEMGLKYTVWHPQKLPIEDFVTRYFPASSHGESAKIISQKQMVLAAKKRVEIEKAKCLPKVGAFAEEYIFNGDRSTASGYSAGIYLRWSLMNSADYGVANEAAMHAQAAHLQVSALADQDRAESLGITATISAIRTSLALMQQSEGLLNEQTKVAVDLFRNGSINALQLTEVFIRRTDLIVSHTDAELALLKLNAQRATKMHFKLPASMGWSNL